MTNRLARKHAVQLDVSVKETSVCIVDDTGRIIREVRVASEPEALLPVLTSDAYHFKRIGLEAGPLSQWLFSALAEAGLPVKADASLPLLCGRKGLSNLGDPIAMWQHLDNSCEG